MHRDSSGVNNRFMSKIIADLNDKNLIIGNWMPKILRYYYLGFPMGYKMPKSHSHEDCIEVMYVEKGRCYMEAGTSKDNLEEATLVRAGEFLLVNGNVNHRMYVEDDHTCKILNIEFGFIPCDDTFFPLCQLIDKGLEWPVPFMQDKPFMLLSDSRDILWILKNIILELHSGGNRPAVDLLLWQFFQNLCHLVKESRLVFGNPKAVCIIKAKRYMKNNYHSGIRVEDAANASGLNRSYFQRIFKEETGQNPIEYLTKLRMMRATELLGKTKLSLAEIAYNAGFGSQQYFSYLFKRETGLSPGSYRRQFEVKRSE